MQSRIPLKECRKVLAETGKNLSDEQILAIRDYLYQLAEIDIAIFRESEKRERDETRRDTERDK